MVLRVKGGGYRRRRMSGIESKGRRVLEKEDEGL